MNVLVIQCSTRGEKSFSNRLCEEILEKIKATGPEVRFRTRDLAKNPLPHLGESQIRAFFTAPDALTDDDQHVLQESEDAIAEVLAADILIIGVPMYNFSIPSALKAWIDHIVRAGRTFNFGSHGPKGLVHGKKVFLAISSGGVYSEGALKPYDYTENYMKTLLAFIGMTEVTTVRAEGVAVSAVKSQGPFGL